jgi:hypothetical protein
MSVIRVGTAMGFSPIVISGKSARVGLKQILTNFSWETLSNLPPSDLLALLVLSLIVLAVAGVFFGLVAALFD